MEEVIQGRVDIILIYDRTIHAGQRNAPNDFGFFQTYVLAGKEYAYVDLGISYRDIIPGEVVVLSGWERR